MTSDKMYNRMQFAQAQEAAKKKTAKRLHLQALAAERKRARQALGSPQTWPIHPTARRG